MTVVALHGGKISSSQRIQDVLIEKISLGEIQPGQRIDASKIAEQEGVSRTPVREAMAHLLAIGILEQRDNRSVFVREYTREDLAQIFEAMHEIEAACARVASQRMSLLSRAEIEAAQSLCLSAAENGDLNTYLKANEAFHSTIYKATANPYLSQIANDFRKRTGPFRAKKFQTKVDLIDSARSHQKLINDIFSEDSDAASESMRVHMTESFLQTLKVN